ncbi:unnamed protein product, partial [Heterotrigona itama]
EDTLLVVLAGNPNDKVLFARCRSMPGRLERRHSLRLWGSARRLHRSGSSRSLPRRPERSDTSSSAEYASTDSAPHSPTSEFNRGRDCFEKIGLLSRLFRRSTRRKGAPLMGTFSAQYPPTEWFNPRVVHLHSVATQTRAASPSMMEGLDQSQASFQVWDDSSSVRSATLPRRHRRQASGDSSSLLANSTPRSSRRHRSPCSTLPRSKCSSLSRCTSRASVLPAANNQEPYQSRNQTQNGKNSANSSPSRSGGSSGSVGTANASPAKTATLGRSSTRQSNSRRPSHDSTGSGTKSNGSPQHKVLQKTSSGHSSHSSGKSISSGKLSSSPLKASTLPAKSSPLKVVQQGSLTPLQEAQNSITLQVSTNLTPVSPSQEQRAIQNSVTLASNATSTTTISGSPGTKIYVQQNNSPMRSVITFENGTVKTKVAEKETDCKEKQDRELIGEKLYKSCKIDEEKLFKSSKLHDDEKLNKSSKLERPSSLYASKESKPSLLLSESDKENKPKVDEELPNKLKLTNRLNNSQAHLIDGSTNNIDKNALVNEHPPPTTLTSMKNTNDAMNNSRKLSLSLSKDALSYRNLLRPGSKNNIASNPPSPSKSFDGFGGSFNNVYIENLEASKQQRAPQGSEPNLEKTVSRGDLYSYPSLSDMQVQFTSLAAQKILKGCPINSVDTLVEVNMAAAEKPNNCDVTVHTDFGLV